MRQFQISTFKDQQSESFAVTIGNTVCQTAEALWKQLQLHHHYSAYAELETPAESAPKPTLGAAVEDFLRSGGTVKLFKSGERMEDPNEALAKVLKRLLRRTMGKQRFDMLSAYEQSRRVREIILGGGNDRAQALLAEAQEILGASEGVADAGLSLSDLGL